MSNKSKEYMKMINESLIEFEKTKEVKGTAGNVLDYPGTGKLNITSTICQAANALENMYIKENEEASGMGPSQELYNDIKQSTLQSIKDQPVNNQAKSEEDANSPIDTSDNLIQELFEQNEEPEEAEEPSIADEKIKDMSESVSTEEDDVDAEEDDDLDKLEESLFAEEIEDINSEQNDTPNSDSKESDDIEELEESLFAEADSEADVDAKEETKEKEEPVDQPTKETPLTVEPTDSDDIKELEESLFTEEEDELDDEEDNKSDDIEELEESLFTEEEEELDDEEDNKSDDIKELEESLFTEEEELDDEEDNKSDDIKELEESLFTEEEELDDADDDNDDIVSKLEESLFAEMDDMGPINAEEEKAAEIDNLEECDDIIAKQQIEENAVARLIRELDAADTLFESDDSDIDILGYDD